MSKFPMKLTRFLFENLFGKAGCPIPPGFDLQREKNWANDDAVSHQPSGWSPQMVVIVKEIPKFAPKDSGLGIDI